MSESVPRTPGGAQFHGDTPRRTVQTFRVKMVLLGSSGVGKSSLALRFSKDEFRSASPTVGCEFMTLITMGRKCQTWHLSLTVKFLHTVG